MFFGFWQFKTTVSLLLFATCLAQDLLRTCDRNYCYERSIDRRDINDDHLRGWQRGERLNNDRERKNELRQEHIENRDDNIRGVRRNRLEMSDLESRRLVNRRENQEIRRELDNITSNRKECTGRESNRIRNENRIVIDTINAVTEDEERRSESSKVDLLAVDSRDNYRNVDRSFDKTRRTQPINERTVERRHNSGDSERESRLVASNRVSERDNQQDEKRESLRFIYRSENRIETSDFELRELVTRRENREIRRKVDNLAANLKERTHRESTRNEHRFVMDDNSVDEGRRDVRDVDRSLDETRTTERFRERTVERRQNLAENESGDRSDTSKRFNERDNQENENRAYLRFSDRLSETRQDSEQRRGREIKVANREARRLNERQAGEKLETLQRIFEERKDKEKHCNRREDLRRTEVKSQHDNTNAIRLSSDREPENERRFEHLKNDGSRRLSLKELDALDNYELRLEDNRQKRVNRLERNHGSQRSNNRIAGVESLLSESERERSLRQYENHEEQGNSRERLNKKQESRHINEIRDILLDEDFAFRRSQVKYALVEMQLDNRREEFRQLGKRDNNRAVNEKQTSRNIRLNRHNDDEFLQRHDKNEREYNQRSRSVRNNENQNYRDFRSMVNKYKEKPILLLNKGYMAFGQGALLAYVIMKTLNGKNDIKCNIYRKLQAANSIMGF